MATKQDYVELVFRSATNSVLLFQVVLLTGTILARRAVVHNPISSSVRLKELRSTTIA